MPKPDAGTRDSRKRSAGATRCSSGRSGRRVLSWPTRRQAKPALATTRCARRREGSAVQAEVLHRRTNTRPSRMLVDLIIPRDERSGSATDAGVPEFMDFMMAEIDRTARNAMRGGLAWIDAQSTRRFGKTVRRRAPTRSARRPRRHRVAGASAAGDGRRRRVLQQLPRPHRVGILVEQDGRQGSASTWATSFNPEVERLSARGARRSSASRYAKFDPKRFALPRSAR